MNKEIMFTLPKNWIWTRLGEISELIRGVTYKKVESSKKPKHGYLPILRANNINKDLEFIDLVYVPQKKIKKEQYVKANDILIAMSSGSKHLVGKAAQALNDFNGGFGTFCGLIRVSTDFDKRFLGLFFQCPYYRNEIAKLSLGVNINNLRREHIELMTFPLPPLPEQHRIVAKIEELFTKLNAGVEALKKIKTQLKRYRQAVLKYAFEGKLTEEWRKKHKDELEPASVFLEKIKEERKKSDKYKEIAPVDISDLSELPEGWVWIELQNIAEFKNGINFTKHQKGKDDGILTVDVLNMYSKGIFINTSELYRVNKSVTDDYLLKYGDILFVRSSVKRKGVGWASAFKEKSEPVTFCGFIIRARLTNAEIMPEFATYFLRTNYARELIVNKGSQVTITNISQSSIGGILIPLTSAKEQHKVVEEIERRFSVADEIEKTVDLSIKHTERLRHSILKRAFEGKLVPQDPNDEPAAKLLERIKAEKAKYDKEKSSKKTWKRKIKLRHVCR